MPTDPINGPDIPSDRLRIPPEEVLQFLIAIEDGAVELTPHWPPDGAAGDVRYRASNGWSITIFNDVNEWDYIAEIRTDDGRFMTDAQIDCTPVLSVYDPGPEIAWTRYGIPGYGRSGCKVCGLRAGAGRDFVCTACLSEAGPRRPLVRMAEWIRGLLGRT